MAPVKPRPKGKRPAIASVPEYLREVLRIADRMTEAAGDTESPWFRGANDRRHHLLPGAYWRRNVDETAAVVEFLAQAPPYLQADSAPENLWDWYFMMQHYGLPTRLLDWTENALIGLYFALEPPGSYPCVWVLDPSRLNEINTGDAGVISPDGDFSDHWLPLVHDGDAVGCRIGKPSGFEFANKAYTNARPLAIFGARRNARILAQQGTFTIHGALREPLDALLGNRTPLVLERIDVRRSARAQLLRELDYCGVQRARVFPELEHLAPYIKQRLLIRP